MLFYEIENLIVLCLLQGRSLLLIFSHDGLLGLTILDSMVQGSFVISQLLISILQQNIYFMILLIELRTRNIKAGLCIALNFSLLARNTRQVEHKLTCTTISFR